MHLRGLRLCSLSWFIVHFIFPFTLNCSNFNLNPIRTALQEVLTLKPSFLSLKCDVLPYLVRSQLVSTMYCIMFLVSSFLYYYLFHISVELVLDDMIC